MTAIPVVAYRERMAFEVEVKYRTKGHEALARRLVELGATAEAEIPQADTYLSHPSRDFAETNEAFRIRRSGDSNRITYKGPRHSGPTKTREEIEVAFAEGSSSYDQLLRLFKNLGFVPVAEIRKTRIAFHLSVQGRNLEVALDVAEGLGTFAEVEVLAESKEALPDAQAAVLALAHEVGLTEVEPRSYLRMFLESSRRDEPSRGESPSDEA
ncbi:class IV adenylate cyclase [Singulisphaera rosea]